MRGLTRSLLLAFGLVVLAGSPAWSHVRPPEPVTPIPAAASFIVSATPEATPLWALLVLAVAGAVAALPRRRAVAFALALLLAVFAAESGVHSVHHLADQQGAAQCVVAAASAHVHGVSLDAPVDALWLPTPVGTVVAADPTRPGARLVRSDEGRAPPA